MEWIRFIRELAWHNAGFSSLRNIRIHLEDYEPRYDPTVCPLPLSEEDAKTEGQEVQLETLIETNRRGSAAKSSRLPAVTDYRDLYLSGQLTPNDVVRAILPLIRRDVSPQGKHFQAWREIHLGMILEAAEASTLRYQNGQSLGPLDGVPTAIKDDYDKDGYSTTLGSGKDYAGEVSDEQSTTSWCVRQLEEQGAVILGKLHMHEYGLGMSIDMPLQITNF